MDGKYGALVEYEQRKTEVLKNKTCPFPTTNPAQGLVQVWNSSLRSERPATNRLTYGTDQTVIGRKTALFVQDTVIKIFKWN